MRYDWEAVYLDGRTATRQPAAVRLMREGIEITPAGGTPRVWPYREIRQTQGFYAGEQVRLERGRDLPETLLVPEHATEAHLELLSELAQMFSDAHLREALAATDDAQAAHRLITEWSPYAPAQRSAAV